MIKTEYIYDVKVFDKLVNEYLKQANFWGIDITFEKNYGIFDFKYYTIEIQLVKCPQIRYYPKDKDSKPFIFQLVNIRAL